LIFFFLLGELGRLILAHANDTVASFSVGTLVPLPLSLRRVSWCERPLPPTIAESKRRHDSFYPKKGHRVLAFESTFPSRAPQSLTSHPPPPHPFSPDRRISATSWMLFLPPLPPGRAFPLLGRAKEQLTSMENEGEECFYPFPSP